MVFFSNKDDLFSKTKCFLILNITFVFLTFWWVYLLFIRTNNIAGIYTFFEFNKQYISSFRFSYPPLSFLLQPTGFFKLLPYYFPIIFGLLVFTNILKKQLVWENISLATIVLAGFAATVYPASDLLHVYPFLGLIVVSSVIYCQKSKRLSILFLLCGIFILLGLYLTFFGKSYRYEDPFLVENTPLRLAKTTGILVYKDNGGKTSLVDVAKFLNEHSQKNDYIFVYPFAPIIYTLLDRQNPCSVVQFDFLPPPKSIYPEERTIWEIKSHRVKYIVTDGSYKSYHTKISQFIGSQKEVALIGPYIIFEVVD